MSNEDIVSEQQKLASELYNIQTAYPVEGNTVSPESTLGLFWQSVKKSGVGQKNFYTVKEAKKLLNKSDFNQLMSEKSNIKFKKIEATGEMKPVKKVKGKLAISKKSFDDAFESKNIEVNYNSPAFKYFAETFTGNTNLENMGTGQKEMLMSHIKSLPRFNNKTKLPNYTPRPYTEEQINGFYNQYQGNRFSNNDIKLAIKNNSNGKDLTPKQVNEFRIDLIDSGRATKVNSRLTMTDDFKIQQARRAESYTNETTSEFIDRLKRTTLLTPEDVDAVANDDAIYKEGVIDSNDVLALPSPEPTQKYSNLLDLMKQRLVDRKMGDIAVAFDKNFKASLNIRQKGNEYFYEPVPKGTDAFFDRPLTKIVLSIEAINPNGTMSETELASELVNRLDHESVHALIELGILKQKEFDILLRDAKRLLPKEFQNKLIADYKANVPSITEEGLNEELVAEFVRLSINNPSKLISPKSKTTIDKIINFLTTFGQTIYDAGFTSSRTIIQDIQSGKIGERERGTLRNAQRLRAENERKYGIARPDVTQLDESKLNKYADMAEFSREEKESLDSKISKINNRIEIEENTLQRDSQYLTNDAYKKESAKIDDLKRKRAKLVEERNNLPPDQEPLFSRAYEDSEPGYFAEKYGSPLDMPLGERVSDRTLEQWLKYHNYESLNVIPDAPKSEGEIEAAYKRNDPVLNETYNVLGDRVDTYFDLYGDGKISKKTYKNPTHRQLLNNFGYGVPTSTQEDVPLFSRADLTPTETEIPQLTLRDLREKNISSNLIIDQLEVSRKGGTRENPGQLKIAITDAFKNSKAISEASKKFLQKFTNNKGNLVLFRSLNIPEGENIQNYGQLEQDEFSSTTLDSRQAQAIGRNLFNRAKDQGATWNTEILRYEVPMSKVKGYVPTLIQTVRKDYIFNEIDSYNGSGIPTQETLDEAREEAEETAQKEYEETGEYNNYFEEEKTQEEYLEDANYILDESIKEAEVIVDLRGIKPTYQYSPKTYRGREESSLTRDVPLFSRASRNFSDGNSNESIKRREAVKVAEERTKETPRGDVPFYNMNASDIALEAAIEFNQDPLKTAPNDIPTFSKAMPSNLQEAADTVGVATPKQSQTTRLIDFASNPIASIKKQFKDFRTNYIDKLDALDKRIIKGSEENDEVRLANNTADTASMAAIRMADRARGIFQQMLLKGIPVDQIEDMPSLTKVIDLLISTRYNPLIEGDTSKGGLMQILSALQSDPEVDLEGVFSLYGKLKRVKKLNDKGVEIASPIGSKELEAIETIEREHPVVVEAYNNYQNWNNGLVDFATRKGLLDADQAAKWIEHSSYYPFYRTMVDDANITAPTIAGGSLPNNPLNMPMKGSEEKIDVDPIEAIARNSLSILTAAMKNDGTMKLIRDLEKLNNPERGIKEATLITDKKQLGGINSVFVFENGNKKHYKIADIDTYMAMQSIGGVKSDGLMKILAMPAGLLRDTVTRDPGFVFVNVFRDTISAAVTSGAPLGGDGFTPILDSFKNLFGDISSLEEFGVIGGYDFANDEGDIKDFLNRARRRAGLSPNNGLRPDVAFYKLWDGLGHLTTKSDGATRKAVADAVYKKLKKSIDPVTGKYYTEAQAQSEAAYQGLEIINFGRRGQSSMFKILTTAIPFLNARVQGLDVLYRSFSGQYSAQDKLQEGGSLEDLQGMIMRRALMRMAVMIGTTAMYYALVGDTDEYKAEKLEKRDDNYIIPIGGGNVIYLPIAFEVGMLTKAIPERLFDLISGEDAFSDTSITDFKDSTVRQLSNSLNLPFLGGDIGIQAFKPIFEAVTNRASFTNSEIVPYFMAKEKPAYQSRKSTNELFRLMGEQLNISPIKLEYIFKGYTGTLGGYALSVTDALARSVTGTPLMPLNIKQIPLVGRFVGDQEKMGGYQQQFYKLREEVNTAVTTMNSLREDGRMDELYAYRNQVQGLLNAKGQVRALERYMRNWRKRRDRIINRTDINASTRGDMLLDLQIDRDKRLAMIPELRQKADIPPDTVGVLLR